MSLLVCSIHAIASNCKFSDLTYRHVIDVCCWVLFTGWAPQSDAMNGQQRWRLHTISTSHVKSLEKIAEKCKEFLSVKRDIVLEVGNENILYQHIDVPSKAVYKLCDCLWTKATVLTRTAKLNTLTLSEQPDILYQNFSNSKYKV